MKKKTRKAEKQHKFVLVKADKWVGLYVDGRCVTQQGSIDLTEWLSKYGVNIKTKYAYKDPQVTMIIDGQKAGVLPEYLKSIVFDTEGE